MTDESCTKTDRRRRDDINGKIQALCSMIPDEFFQENSGSTGSITTNEQTPVGTPGTPLAGRQRGPGTKDGRPNKGQILTQAVEYVTHLQGLVDQNNRQEVALMLELQKLARDSGVNVTDMDLENTSAEVALAKIGVGPLALALRSKDMIESNRPPS